MKIRQRLAAILAALAVVLSAVATMPVHASRGPGGWGCAPYVLCIDLGWRVFCFTWGWCPRDIDDSCRFSRDEG